MKTIFEIVSRDALPKKLSEYFKPFPLLASHIDESVQAFRKLGVEWANKEPAAPQVKQSAKELLSHLEDKAVIFAKSIREHWGLIRLIKASQSEGPSEVHATLSAMNIEYAYHQTLPRLGVHAAFGSKIIRLTKGLGESLKGSDLKDILMGDIVWPIDHFYIQFPKHLEINPIDGLAIDGCCVNHFESQDGGYLLLSFLGYREKENDFKTPIAIPIEVSYKANDPIHNLMANAVFQKKEFYKKVFGNEMEMFSMISQVFGKAVTDKKSADQLFQKFHAHRNIQTFIELERNVEDVNGALSLILNTILYMGAYQEDTQEDFSEDAPERLAKQVKEGSDKERKRAKSKLQALGFSPLFTIGKNFEKVTLSEGGEGVSRKGGLRRGSWVKQAHGKGRLLRKIQWRRQTIVKGVKDDFSGQEM